MSHSPSQRTQSVVNLSTNSSIINSENFENSETISDKTHLTLDYISKKDNSNNVKGKMYKQFASRMEKLRQKQKEALKRFNNSEINSQGANLNIIDGNDSDTLLKPNSFAISTNSQFLNDSSSFPSASSIIMSNSKTPPSQSLHTIWKSVNNNSELQMYLIVIGSLIPQVSVLMSESEVDNSELVEGSNNKELQLLLESAVGILRLGSNLHDKGVSPTHVVIEIEQSSGGGLGRLTFSPLSSERVLLVREGPKLKQ